MIDTKSHSKFNRGRVLGTDICSVSYEIDYQGKKRALKVFQSHNPEDFEKNLSLFRNEARLLSRIKNSGLIEVFEYINSQDEPYVISEMNTGISLLEKIKQGHLTISEIIQLASGLAQTLSAVHRCQVTVQNLKAENITVDSFLYPKIIDFKIAREICSFDVDENDYRLKDLNSLGLLLRELLSSLKENSKDPRAELFNQIIELLVSQDPLRRYQTALGVALDLEQLQEKTNLSDMRLRQYDIRLRQSSRIPLVGRKDELTKLAGSFQKSKLGYGNLTIIESQPGGGKTHLAQHFLAQSPNKNELLLSGKVRTGEKIPYLVFKEILENLLQKISTLQPTDLFCERVRSSLEGCNAIQVLSPSFLSNFNLSSVEATQYQNREQFVIEIAQFFLNLSDEFNGLTLFIEDIQWLDSGSQEVIQKISEGLYHRNIFLLMTASSDLQSKAQTQRIIESWKAAPMTRLHLGQLGFPEMKQIANYFLNGLTLSDDTIYKFFYRSRGNPFVFIQFLYSMVNAQIVKNNNGECSVDDGRFESLELSSDLMTLFSESIKKTQPTTQRLLKIGTFLGRNFMESHLRAFASEVEVQRALGEALSSHLIEVDSQGYLHFLHDKLREALVSLMDVKEKQELQQKIAEAMSLGIFSTYTIADNFFEGVPSKNPQVVYDFGIEASAMSLKEFSVTSASDFLIRTEKIYQEYKIKDAELLTKKIRARIHLLKALNFFNENHRTRAWTEIENGLRELGYTLPTTFWGTWLRGAFHKFTSPILSISQKNKFLVKNKIASDLYQAAVNNYSLSPNKLKFRARGVESSQAQLDVVLKISEMANTSLNLKEFANQSLQQIGVLFKARQAHLIMGQSLTSDLEILGSYFSDKTNSVTKINAALVAKSLTGGEPAFGGPVDLSPGRREQNIISVPLKLKGKVLGVLYLDLHNERNTFRKNDLFALRSIARQVSLYMDKVSSTEKINRLFQQGMSLGLHVNSLSAFKSILDEIIKSLDVIKAFVVLDLSTNIELKNGFGRHVQGLDVKKMSDPCLALVQRCKDENRPIVFESADATEMAGLFIAAAPLVIKDKIIGALCIENHMNASLEESVDLDLFTHLARQLALIISYAQVTQVEIEKIQNEKDLQFSAAAKELFLPQSQIFENSWVKLEGFYKSSTQSGGDWWWYDTWGHSQILVLIGDVKGPGVGPAMVTGVVAACYQSLLDSSEQRTVDNLLKSMDQVLQKICQGNYLMSLSALLVDHETGKVSWWTAGGTDLICVNSPGDLQLYSNKGNLLGSGNFQLGYKETRLQDGTTLYLYTDGATELKNSHGVEFGLRRLIRAIDSLDHNGTENFTSTLGEKVLNWTEGQNLNDDVVIVGIKYKGKKGQIAS